MLTRALFALVLICGMAATAAAEDAKVLALGINNHETTQEEIEKGRSAEGAAFQYSGHRLCARGRPQGRSNT